MEHLHLNKNLVLEGTSGLSDAEYALLGVPFDGTQSHRTGSREGPLEIRRTLLELDKDGFYDRKWVDLGNVDVVYGNAAETLARTRDVVSDVLAKNPKIKLITLGGEHTISHPVVEVLASGGGLHVIAFDAHADLRDEYESEKIGHATVLRRISELGVNLTLAGVRSASDGEREHINENNLTVFGPDEIDANKILADVKEDRVYVSVDLDVLSPYSAPGVGNPEPGGVSFNKLNEIIGEIIESSTVVGLDVVELSPAHDNGGAAASAARLVVDFIC